jgi:hypothetical protein
MCSTVHDTMTHKPFRSTGRQAPLTPVLTEVGAESLFYFMIFRAIDFVQLILNVVVDLFYCF